MLKLICLTAVIALGHAAPIADQPAPSSSSTHWSYGDVEHWGKVAAVCNTGKRQSPIDVETSTVQGDATLADDKLVFDRYSGSYQGDYFNNGHTIQFTINASVANDARPRIYGGGLGKEGYIFEQFHLHWGNESECEGAACKGAEHTIDGESAPAEIHFVHFNAKYGNIGEAVKHSDGLAVIGFLFEVVSDAGLVKTDYAKEAELVAEIKSDGNHTFPIFNFGTVLPPSAIDGTGLFYRYDGSLTTPPCAEVVTWTLFDERVPILGKTLAAFHDAAFGEHDEATHAVVIKNILNNYRPPQPLNGRVVKSNKREASLAGSSTPQADNAAMDVRTSISTLMVTVGAVFCLKLQTF